MDSKLEDKDEHRVEAGRGIPKQDPAVEQESQTNSSSQNESLDDRLRKAGC